MVKKTIIWKMKNYTEFVNENLNYLDPLLGSKTDKLLRDLPELKNEELEELEKLGYRTLEQLYSVITISQNLKEGVRDTMGVNENRYEEILDVIKSNLDPVRRKEIEEFVPTKYAMGAVRPPKDFYGNDWED